MGAFNMDESTIHVSVIGYEEKKVEMGCRKGHSSGLTSAGSKYPPKV
jgi:hypothetical protein